MDNTKYNEDFPYSPKPFEISSISLFGKRQEDGSIILGENKEKPTIMPDFPKSICIGGVTYTLENIEKNRDICHISKGCAGYDIEWGEYV